jgi:Uncharacterized protein conserved in bacteria (DUF2147)
VDESTDIYNPDPKKRRCPIIGLVFISGLTKKSDARWETGTVYGATNHLGFDNSRRHVTRSSVFWNWDFEPPLSPKATQANRQSTQIEVRGS